MGRATSGVAAGAGGAAERAWGTQEFGLHYWGVDKSCFILQGSKEFVSYKDQRFKNLTF